MEDARHLLDQIKAAGQLEAVMHQLKKDYERANVTFPFGEPAYTNLLTSEILQRFHENLYFLLMEHFDHYLNLMYTADVPEHEFREIQPTDVVEVAEEVVMLLLKREWQKVQLRSRFDQK